MKLLCLIVQLTAGGQKIEGKMKKFVSHLDHVSFDPAYGRNREILYVTERAVFRWEQGGLALIEVAPGIDIERDVLAQMEFGPRLEVVAR